MTSTEVDQRSSKGHCPLAEVFEIKFIVSTHFGVFPWELDTVILW